MVLNRHLRLPISSIPVRFTRSMRITFCATAANAPFSLQMRQSFHLPTNAVADRQSWSASTNTRTFEMPRVLWGLRLGDKWL
jgi:hypothetical protein